MKSTISFHFITKENSQNFKKNAKAVFSFLNG